VRHPSEVRALIGYFSLYLLTLATAATGCSRLNHPPPVSPSAQAGATSKAAPTSTSSLRIATYNVHMETAEGIRAAIARNPRLNQADVIMLQEIEAHDSEDSPRAAQVARDLDMHWAYAPGYGLSEGGSHGVAILSRFPLADLEVIELPYYHVVVNSARRVALAATIALGERNVRIYSVHLDNRINPSRRRQQLAPVFAAADRFRGPAIIAGDLNTSPFCWGGGLVPLPCGQQDDAVESQARGHGFATPLAEGGPTSKWMAMKLDAIYVRQLVTRASAVEHAVRLSDHLPVWLDVELAAPRTALSASM
jgi:endonuclease/exonuclease/phosphatase family metal-dependent hydrolase